MGEQHRLCLDGQSLPPGCRRWACLKVAAGAECGYWACWSPL